MQRRGETILLTGPPLSGKTSTAVLWTEGRERLTSWIDWDQLTGTLFSTRLRQEPAMISDHYRFSAKIIAATARMINESVADCVIAGARVPASPTDPPEWVGVWMSLTCSIRSPSACSRASRRGSPAGATIRVIRSQRGRCAPATSTH